MIGVILLCFKLSYKYVIKNCTNFVFDLPTAIAYQRLSACAQLLPLANKGLLVCRFLRYYKGLPVYWKIDFEESQFMVIFAA